MWIIQWLVIILLCCQRCCGYQNNWLLRQRYYVWLGQAGQDHQLKMDHNMDKMIKYFAVDMEDMENFDFHLRKILIPRVPGTVGNMLVREHIVKSMEELGWIVEINSYLDTNNVLNRSIPFNNVIATLDEKAPRRLLIACHYDSKMTPKNFLAATDSAVPCAQMINLATVMKKDLNRLKYQNSEVTLQFVFFDGEEAFMEWTATDSLYGSRHLARSWEKEHGYRYQGFPPRGTNTLRRIDVFMLLDLLGTNDPEPTVVSSRQTTHNWYKRLRTIEEILMYNRHKFGILQGTHRRIFITSGDRADFHTIQDDHVPFDRRGVPVLHIIAKPFPNQWHKIGDDLSNVHYPTVEKLNKIFRFFVAEYLQLEYE